MSSPFILVVGGAGFIGSHACKTLHRQGFRPVVVDDLSNGDAAAAKWGPVIFGRAGDNGLMRRVVRKFRPVGVLYFASFIESSISKIDPIKYYKNNIAEFLECSSILIEENVGRVVFSSSAAVYGGDSSTPISETQDLNPLTPYGHSKAVVEHILQELSLAHDLRYCALRYFNAAGADPEGELSENHEPETHLVPLAIRASFDPSSELRIYGTDYDTPDGTCIRDYVHVSDLAEAHVAALKRLISGGENLIANLGAGRGHSVREVIDMVQVVSGKPVRVREMPRRAGDPAILVADISRAKRELNWSPGRSRLETIVQDALNVLGRRLTNAQS
jgi:UDP-glucose-4-epimerase GalE